MEHIYTIKVKRQFDPRGLYPSERRYSASTVAGLAWLHLALAATAALLAGLALHNPGLARLPQLELTETDRTLITGDGPRNASDIPEYSGDERYPVTLAVAPALLAVGALAAGLAAVLASRRWYVDHNIAWFFLSSILATLLSLAALCMMIAWIAAASENGLNFCDYFSDGNLFGKVKMVPDGEAPPGNGSWFYVITVPVRELRSRNIPLPGERSGGSGRSGTRKVLSINILIAAAVEALWALLSLKIAWRGMRADYPEDACPDGRRRPTVRVVTEIKGNNTEHLPKNTKILPPQPDLIEHHPKNSKIKKFFQSQRENGGFFLRTSQNENGLLVLGADSAKVADFPQRESTAEYRERMLDFLNRCAAGGPDRPESAGPEEPAEGPGEGAGEGAERPPDRASWGDVRDYTVYDQNTLDLNEIMLTFERRKAEAATATSAEEAGASSVPAAPETPVEAVNRRAIRDSRS